MLNTRICLLEPTDWVGGQLTSELLRAPDFASHSINDKDTNFTLDVGYIDRRLENQNLLFTKMLAILGNTGHCLVSPKCSIHNQFHSHVLLPLINEIRIFYNTVIKHITKDESGRRIIQIDAIQRIPLQSADNNCRFLSEEYLIGTSWGEVLVLANASYLQGTMEQFDGNISGIGNSSCVQSFTFDFLEQLHETPVDEPSNPLPEPTRGDNYSLKGPTWERIWIYRRVNTSATNQFVVAVNDLTIQNWAGGNDYQ